MIEEHTAELTNEPVNVYNFQADDFNAYYFGKTIVEIIVQEAEKMELYKNGYVVSEVKDNDHTYNVWPLEDMYNDNIAMLLTEKADNNWFLQYDMQHIVPDFRFAYKYFRCCQEKGIKANILLYETPDSEIIVSDNNLPTKLLGFDCIGNVYYSYLKNEYNYFKEDLNAKGIYLNRYGLFKTLEDTLFFINIRRQDINNGIALEDFWEQLPVKISLVKI